MPIAPDQISEGHCYLLHAKNGRLIVARVSDIVDAPVRVSDNIGEKAEALHIGNKIVRFHWRTSSGTWSASHEQKSLANFAIEAEKEVACD